MMTTRPMTVARLGIQVYTYIYFYLYYIYHTTILYILIMYAGKLKFTKHIDDFYRGGDGRTVDDYKVEDSREARTKYRANDNMGKLSRN